VSFLGRGAVSGDDPLGYAAGKDRRPHGTGFRCGREPEQVSGRPSGIRYAGTTPTTDAVGGASTDRRPTDPLQPATQRADQLWYAGPIPTTGALRSATGCEGNPDHGHTPNPGGSPGDGELPGQAGSDWLGGEVIESGPERPPTEGGVERLVGDARRWWRDLGAAGPWRRRVVAAAAAAAAAGAIVALRAAAPDLPLEEEAAAAGTPGAPMIIYGRARLQPPPFDRLPGRTPIPLPSPVGRPAEVVRGDLPATGTVAGETSARAAARLVLGRYCRYPQAYFVVLDPHRDWRKVTATAIRRTYGEPRRLTTLQLEWTGHWYVWQGSPAELAHCA